MIAYQITSPAKKSSSPLIIITSDLAVSIVIMYLFVGLVIFFKHKRIRICTVFFIVYLPKVFYTVHQHISPKIDSITDPLDLYFHAPVG